MDADEQEFVDYEGDDDYEQQMDDAEVADLVEEEGVDYEDEGDVADEEVDEEQPIKTEDDHNYGDEELQGLAEDEEQQQQPRSQGATPPAMKEEAGGRQVKKERVIDLNTGKSHYAQLQAAKEAQKLAEEEAKADAAAAAAAGAAVFDGGPQPAAAVRPTRAAQGPPGARQLQQQPQQQQKPQQPQQQKQGLTYFIVTSRFTRNYDIAKQFSVWGIPPGHVHNFRTAFARGPVVLFMSVNKTDAFQGYGWMTSDCGQGPDVNWVYPTDRPVKAKMVNFSVQWETTAPVPMTAFAHLRNSLAAEDPALDRQRNGQQVEAAVGHQMVMLFRNAAKQAGMPVPPFSYKHGKHIREQALAAQGAQGLRPGPGAGPMLGGGPGGGGYMPPPGMRMGMPMGMPGPPGRMGMGPGPMGFAGPRGPPGGMMGMGPGMGLPQPPPPPGRNGLPSRFADRLTWLREEDPSGHPQQQHRGRSRSPGGTRSSRQRSRSRSPVGAGPISYERYLNLYSKVQKRIAAVRGEREAAAAGVPGKGAQQQQQQQQQQRQPQQQQLAVLANGGWGNPGAAGGPSGAAGAGRGGKKAAGGGAGGGSRGQQPMAGQQMAAGGGPMGGMPGMQMPSEEQFVQAMEASYRQANMAPPNRPLIIAEYHNRRAMMQQRAAAMMMGPGAGGMGMNMGMMGMGGMQPGMMMGPGGRGM